MNTTSYLIKSEAKLLTKNMIFILVTLMTIFFTVKNGIKNDFSLVLINIQLIFLICGHFLISHQSFQISRYSYYGYIKALVVNNIELWKILKSFLVLNNLIVILSIGLINGYLLFFANLRCSLPAVGLILIAYLLVTLFYNLLSINIALNIASINTVGSISTISMYVNTAVAYVLVPFKYNDPLFIIGFGLATVILLVMTTKSTKNMYKNIVNRRQV